MVTLADPRIHLVKANGVRLDVAQLRIELAAGLIDLADAIHDRRADSVTVYNLLRAMRGVGPVKAERACRRALVRSNKRCSELTLRQKGVIVAEVLR